MFLQLSPDHLLDRQPSPTEKPKRWLESVGPILSNILPSRYMAGDPLWPASSGDRRPSNCNDNRATCRSRRHSILRRKPHTFSVVSILLRLRRFSENCEYANRLGSPARSPSTRCSGHTFPEGTARLFWVPSAPQRSRPTISILRSRIGTHLWPNVKRARPNETVVVVLLCHVRAPACNARRAEDRRV
jgi:hypothetical protein